MRLLKQKNSPESLRAMIILKIMKSWNFSELKRFENIENFPYFLCIRRFVNYAKLVCLKFSFFLIYCLRLF